MTQDKSKKKMTVKKRPQIDQKAAEVIKIMANTKPISNEELKKRSEKRTQ